MDVGKPELQNRMEWSSNNISLFICTCFQSTNPYVMVYRLAGCEHPAQCVRALTERPFTIYNFEGVSPSSNGRPGFPPEVLCRSMW